MTMELQVHVTVDVGEKTVALFRALTGAGVAAARIEEAPRALTAGAAAESSAEKAAPAPVSVPAPAPASEPKSARVSRARKGAAAAPAPEVAPEPTPEPAPEPTPEPTPESMPKPVSPATRDDVRGLLAEVIGAKPEARGLAIEWLREHYAHSVSSLAEEHLDAFYAYLVDLKTA